MDPDVTDADVVRYLQLLGAPAAPRSAGGVKRARRRRVVDDEGVRPTYQISVDDVDLRLDRRVRARLYRPLGGEALATMVYLHGGGWALGDLDINDDVCRFLCERAGVVVVSLDYPLAPEHPFPAALDVASQACRAVAEGSLGIDVPRRLVVGGLSAGAALAAALAARGVRGGPRCSAQVLLCPVLDSDLGRASYLRYADGPVLTADDMRWFWSLYDPDGTARASADAAPLRASGFAGLPPTVVVVASVDPLRDEALAYVEALRAADVPVDAVLVEGVTHGFMARPAVRSGRRALDQVAVGLREVLTG